MRATRWGSQRTARVRECTGGGGLPASLPVEGESERERERERGRERGRGGIFRPAPTTDSKASFHQRGREGGGSARVCPQTCPQQKEGRESE